MNTITSRILMQLQGNSEDTKTKACNLSYRVKSNELKRWEENQYNLFFIDDISISENRDVRKIIQEDRLCPRVE